MQTVGKPVVGPPSGLLDGLTGRAELAKEFGITDRTIRRWEVRGMPFILVGRMRLYEPIAIRAWLMRHQQDYCAPPRKPGRPRRAESQPIAAGSVSR